MHSNGKFASCSLVQYKMSPKWDVDHVLKSSGYPGDTMGERLKNIDKAQIVTLDGLWEAHKIRNRLAHDLNYFLRYGEAKRAVQLYEKTLKELNAL